MPTRDNIVTEVIGILRQMPSGAHAKLDHGTKVLSELDLDSLQMLELVEILRERYGVDFLAAPLNLANLATPETIADTIMAEA